MRETHAVCFCSHSMCEESNLERFGGMGVGNTEGRRREYRSNEFWEVILLDPSGSVHKSVAGSLAPRKIIRSLYFTMHSLGVNVTSHPAVVRTRMPKSEATDRSGTMCPVRTVGSPSISTSHICVDVTMRPSASATFNGRVVGRRFTTGVPSITKI